MSSVDWTPQSVQDKLDRAKLLNTHTHTVPPVRYKFFVNYADSVFDKNVWFSGPWNEAGGWSRLAADKCCTNETIATIRRLSTLSVDIFPLFFFFFLALSLSSFSFLFTHSKSNFAALFMKMCKSFVCDSFRSFMPFHSRQFNHLTFSAKTIHQIFFWCDFCRQKGSISLSV